jgi:hypothetical protein
VPEQLPDSELGEHGEQRQAKHDQFIVHEGMPVTAIALLSF